MRAAKKKLNRRSLGAAVIDALERRVLLSTTWTVTSTADVGTTAGTLRNAILNSAAGDIVKFDSTVFAPGVLHTITLGGTELLITHSLNIQGPGANVLDVDANSASRVFNISTGDTVAISGMTISGGVQPTSGMTLPPAINGGGIQNNGTLTVTDCTLSNDKALSNIRAYLLGIPLGGGGIDNQGTLNVIGTTFIGDASSNGSAVLAEGKATNLVNCTFTNCTDSPFTAGSVIGMAAGGSLSITNCSIANNQGIGVGYWNPGLPGPIFPPGPTTTINNTIIANNLLDNGTTSVDTDVEVLGFSASISGSYNLIGAASAQGLDAAHHNTFGAKPNFSPLLGNGGTTPTLLPQSPSPAIDAGSNALAVGVDGVTPLATDQRGMLRIYNGTVDIGADEVQPAAAPTGLKLTIVGGKVNLSWNASAAAFAYNVYRGTSPGGEAAIPIASPPGTSFIDSNVTTGTIYYYQVTALVSEVGQSPRSNEVFAAVPAASSTINSVTGTTNLVTIEGSPVSGVLATFKDSNSNALADLSATVNWGDGTAVTAGSISFNSTSGNYQVSSAHTYKAPRADYFATVSITDTAAGTGQTAAKIYVADAPLHPFPTTIAAAPGKSFTGVVGSFTDSDPNSQASFFTSTIVWGDGHVSLGTVTLNSLTHRYDVSGANAYAAPGTYAVGVSIFDTGGGMTLRIASSAVVTGIAVPGPVPQISGAASVTVGASYGITFSATDVGGQPITKWVIDWGDGTVVTLAGSATSSSHTYTTAPASRTVKATATDQANLSASASLSVQVNAAGTTTLVVTGSNITAVEGFAFSGVIASFTDPKPNFTSGFYAATISWGDGSSSAGAVSFNSSLGQFQVTAGHAYKLPATYHPQISITSAGGNGGTIAKVYVADAPLHPFPTTITASAGKAFSGVVGSFTDSDPNQKLSYYTSTITWGDGHTSAGTIAFNTLTHRYDVSGTNTYAAGGSFPVNVFIADTGGMNLKISSAASVSGTPAGVSAHTSGAANVNEGSSYSVSFSATDAGGKAISKWVVDWGDGTVIQFAGTATGASHTYADGPASRTVKATATDSVGLSGSASLVVHVNNVAPTAKFKGVSPVAANHTSTVQFSSQFDPSPVDTAAGFHYSYDFLDNGTFEIVNSTSSSATVPAIYLVTLGQKTIHGRIIDKDGGFTDYTTTISVISAVLNPFGTTLSLTEGTKFSGVVGSFTNPTPGTVVSNYAATITWGDGHVSTGSIALNTSTGRFDVSGSNTYGDEGSFGISVQVNANSGAATTIHSTANVHDAALSGATGISFSKTEGQLFSGTVATFSDANPLAAAKDFTASINWGDGSSSAGSVSFNGISGKWQVAGNHTYRVGGSYNASVSIKDIGGSSASAGLVATVAAAPIFANGLATTTTMIQDVLASSPQLIATFASGNPLAKAGDFVVSIDWGDNTPNPIETINVVFDSINNVFDVMATHPYSLINKNYTVTIAVSEGTSTSKATATTFLKIT